MRQCKKCGEEKALEAFVVSSRAKGGRTSCCRECQAKYRADYYQANREKAKAYSLEWKAQNPNWVKDYEQRNRDAHIASSKAWKQANKDRIKAYETEYRKANAEHIRKRKAKVLAANRELHAARVSAWAKANPERKRANQGKRKASKLLRTPAWSDPTLVARVYAYAKWLEEVVGVPCHVDHIIPLQGTLASGLHDARNLRVVLGSDNCAKRNSVDHEGHTTPCALDDAGFQTFLRDERTEIPVDK